jgi:hypothetical protein
MSIATLRNSAIARARRAVQEMMTSTATIKRNTGARNSGGYAQNFVTVGTTPCLMTASVLGGGAESESAGQLVATMQYTLTVPGGTDIKPRDRIVVGGTTFEVLACKRSDTWNTSDSATLVEIQH